MRGSLALAPLLPALASLLLALASPHVEASESKAEARTLFKKGNRLLMAGDNIGALELFQAAYELYPSPRILINIGTCYLEMGRNAEAADTFARYLADPKAEKKRVREVEGIIERLDGELAHLRLPVVESGTRVLVDGKPIDPSRHGQSMRIKPGSHVVVAERENAPPTVATVRLAPGEEKAVELRVARAARPAVSASDEPSGTGAEPVARVDRGEVPTTLSHGGQLGAWVRTDVDGEGRGAVAVVGVSLGIGAFVEPAVAAILGDSKGVEPGLTAFLTRGRWKPTLYLGAPAFFVDGPHWGVHAAAGVQWDPSRRLGLYVAAGLEHFPSAPAGFDTTLFVPSAGMQGRL